VPHTAFDFGSLDPIRTDRHGYVHAPPGDGLGVRVDWPAIEGASIAVFDQTRKGLKVAAR
jgi:L-alanine-DL-glutamate epimerase-like enolase superfamily enzyme